MNAEKVGPHRRRALGKSILVTAEAGGYAFLSPEEYDRYLGGLSPGDPRFDELRERGLIRNYMDFDRLASEALANSPLGWQGPESHLVVVGRAGRAMSLAIARKSVEFILRAPGPLVSIELDLGGVERAWPVARFMVEYARLRAGWLSRVLRLVVRVRPDGLSPERADFLAAQSAEARVCWGPGDAPRGAIAGRATRGLLVVDGASKNPGAWAAYWSRLGLASVRLAPGCEADRFLPFYRAAFARMARAGVKEEWMEALLRRVPEAGSIPAERTPFPLPGLPILGELVYEPSGRILAGEGGPEIGTVVSTAFEELAEKEEVQACVAQTQGPDRPLCFQCAYRPYCSLSPALCAVHLGLFDLLFGNMAKSSTV
ncbi:MAG TPA: hypothetical protein VNI01_01580 [Elusimicrobiota bacterium]|nr:hypothetical protein [Elusimicrobiota bacterium]